MSFFPYELIDKLEEISRQVLKNTEKYL